MINGESDDASKSLPVERPTDMGDWRAWLRWSAAQDWTDPASWQQFVVPWTTATAAAAGVPTGVETTWVSIAEDEPGAAFAAHWRRVGPPTERWWLTDARADEDGAAVGMQQLERHMPELVPLWEQLVDLAGGGPTAASILALWNPPAFLTGCSQAVVTVGGPALVRNYDWDYRRFDATVASTGYLGRQVVGTEDCGWGLLDGVNDAGLAVSLTFGGRPDVGEGFGIPLVLRYLLQTCEDVDGAVTTLVRLPIHMAYNVTLTDARGRIATVFVGPHRPPRATDLTATTNHQGVVEWRPYCDAIHSEERLSLLTEELRQGADVAALTAAFQREPLYATRFHHGFGTLYTAVIRPDERSITYHWPGREPWRHSLAEPRADETQVDLGRPEGVSL